ncbi:fimbria/pilus outer membrane usher protein [Orbus wheelerorum]|uniref:fimbria/pilus outer membrane usher protein n=1 Tax=Orbus wheelerorum TaxID=3074111 RepID=UPI00370D76F5
MVFKGKYRLNKLASYIALLMTVSVIEFNSSRVYAKDYFNPNALSDIDGVDLADLQSLDPFSTSGAQLPGEYNVNVIVNDRTIGVIKLDFVRNDEGQLEPVLTKQMLTEWGVKTNVIPSLKELNAGAKLEGINHYIEFASSQFIFSQQILKISIPQIALNADIRGNIDPALFDQGMPAFILNYDLTGARSWYKNSDYQDNQFLSLRSGINLGAWRLRNYATYEHSDNSSKWSSINTYLERDIQPLNSQLSLGEVTTDGDIFNGFQFKGVKVSSDEGMLPYSLRGFAPVVRGFAQGNAKVTVRQNGAVIYQTYVSAGPFVFNDLYPTSYSGNLDVTVEEENGSSQSFVVPFASLAIMQREGSIKYSATVGKYRSESDNGKTPHFMEGTIIYGLPWNTTIYGGALLSSDYQSYALGVGFNLGSLGAISFDGKYASTQFDFERDKQTGQAYRLQYSKTLQETHSTISLDAYRYSSKGFYDFSEANENTDITSRNSSNKRSRYQLNLSQSLASYGSFYVNAYQQDYWHSSGKDRNITAGYNVVSNGISYGLSYGYTDSTRNNNTSHQVTFRVNIPLGEWLSTRNYLTSSVSYAGQGKTTAQTGISGNALDNNLTYSVQQSYVQQNHYVGGNASVGYQGSNGNVNMGYAYTQNSQRFNYGWQGAVVAHPYGVTLSQTVGDTIALVAAPGASDVSLQNTQGVKTNYWGYAVKPYLTPYAENKIALNASELAENVDIINNSVTVIPTKGAVVLAKMNTRIGYRILMTLSLNGKALPFGSSVTLSDGESNSIVGDNGEVYLSGMPESGSLIAKWGNKAEQMCHVNYQLPDDAGEDSIKFITAQCTQ